MNEFSNKIIMLHLKRQIRLLEEKRDDDHVAKTAVAELRKVIRTIDTEIKYAEKNGVRTERDVEILKEMYEEMF